MAPSPAPTRGVPTEGARGARTPALTGFASNAARAHRGSCWQRTEGTNGRGLLAAALEGGSRDVPGMRSVGHRDSRLGPPPLPGAKRPPRGAPEPTAAKPQPPRPPPLTRNRLPSADSLPEPKAQPRPPDQPGTWGTRQPPLPTGRSTPGPAGSASPSPCPAPRGRFARSRSDPSTEFVTFGLLIPSRSAAPRRLHSFARVN